MDGDATPQSRPTPSKVEPTQPTEAELSRIAREAVRQSADPRIDRQLEWMGLTEPSEGAEREARPQRAVPDRSAAEIERLDRRLRRVEIVLALLVVAVVIVALVEVVLASR